jgi:uncharacterized protein YciI
MATFLYQLFPCRPTFGQEITPAEQAIVGEHFRYLQALLAKGQLYVAGRTEGAEFGICIFEAESEAVAQAILENDPVVAKGLMTAKLYPYRIALMKGAEGN